MSMSSTQNLVHLSIPKWRWQVKQKRSETLSQGNCQCCLGMENHTKKIKMVPFCKIRTSGCHSLCFLKIKKGEQQKNGSVDFSNQFSFHSGLNRLRALQGRTRRCCGLRPGRASLLSSSGPWWFECLVSLFVGRLGRTHNRFYAMDSFIKRYWMLPCLLGSRKSLFGSCFLQTIFGHSWSTSQ
jgi:hypothetical protein